MAMENKMAGRFHGRSKDVLRMMDVDGPGKHCAISVPNTTDYFVRVTNDERLDAAFDCNRVAIGLMGD